MRQMMTLADKGWTDMKTMISVLDFKSNARVASLLLVISALLCGLGKDHFISGLVSTKPTNHHSPFRPYKERLSIETFRALKA